MRNYTTTYSLDKNPNIIFYKSENEKIHSFSEVVLKVQQTNGESGFDWERAMEGAMPVAISVEFAGSAEAGGASSMTPWGGILVTRGPDKWKFKSFTSGGAGTGWVSANAMALGYTYYYTGDVNNFSMATFEGWGNNVSVTGDAGVAVGVNISWVENPNAPGEYLIGIGGGLGVGIGPTVISGQYTRQFTHIFW